MRDEDREDLDLFEMTNLFPDTTGLPMTIWASPRGYARHAARIKVAMKHGPKVDIRNTASVRIEPVALMEGSLTTPDKQAVFAWIDRNKDALMDLWNGKIDGSGFTARLVRNP